jgi:hypothetical protein
MEILKNIAGNVPHQLTHVRFLFPGLVFRVEREN